jgi:DNA-binding MarR family transcriptional regulator
VKKLIQKDKFASKLFLRPKPVRMLICLKSGPKYATIVAKEVDCTYSHTVKLLDLFRILGLVEFEKKGRIKIVKLTEMGEDLARNMDTVLLKLNKLKEKTI